MKIHIRLALPEDLQRITSISLEFMHDVGMPSEKWERKLPRLLLQIKAHLVWVAEEAGQVRGYIALSDASILPILGDKRVHITNTVVDRTWRRHSIAEKLRRHMIEQVWSRGYQLITTNHQRDNHAIISLSEKLGFIQYLDRDFSKDCPDDLFYCIRCPAAGANN